MHTREAPDGGYAWVIVFASAMSNIVILKSSLFGLIYKDVFVTYGLSATQESLIINVNAAFGMTIGPIIGALQKHYGFRKIAFVGGFCSFLGLFLTAFATTFEQFLITYGIIASLGTCFIRSSYSLAVNTYFSKNRGKAVAASSTLTALAPIVMPQLINYLLLSYDVQGVTLILSALATHSIATAFLLHPVDWHTDKKKDSQKQNGLARRKNDSVELRDKNNNLKDLQPVEPNGSPRKELSKFWAYFSNLFDLDLFEDPVFINIMVGLSMAFFVEVNFTILTAFILKETGLDTKQIASFMSVLGSSDICFRFLAPYLAEFLKKSPRFMCSCSFLILVITRYWITIISDYPTLLTVGFIMGIGRGLRSVYMPLVIPSYVPLTKLPSVSGIQMMINGLLLLIGGPVLGMVRDMTGSYSACISIMNYITVATVAVWSVEPIFLTLNKFSS